MDIIEMFEELGIQKNEASIYLALVKSGGMNASEVAAAVNMHRPNVYDILKRLENRGLIGSFTLNGKTKYVSRGIDAIKDYWEEKVDYLDKIDNQLKKYKAKEKECEVTVFDGSKCLRIVHFDILKEIEEKGGDCLIMGLDEKQTMEMDELSLKRYFEIMGKEGWKEKVIVSEKETFFPGPNEVTEYRTLPERYFDSSTMYICYSDRLALLIFTEPAHLIVIKSKVVSDNYKKKFELLWKIAKKVRK